MTTPNYYKSGIKKGGLADGSLEAMDVIDDLELNFNLGCVVKYVWRHGRKPGATAIGDLRKARDCLEREIGRMADVLERSRDGGVRSTGHTNAHINWPST